jgi:hypothetical protein
MRAFLRGCVVLLPLLMLMLLFPSESKAIDNTQTNSCYQYSGTFTWWNWNSYLYRSYKYNKYEKFTGIWAPDLEEDKSVQIDILYNNIYPTNLSTTPVTACTYAPPFYIHYDWDCATNTAEYFQIQDVCWLRKVKFARVCHPDGFGGNYVVVNGYSPSYDKGGWDDYLNDTNNYIYKKNPPPNSFGSATYLIWHYDHISNTGCV